MCAYVLLVLVLVYVPIACPIRVDGPDYPDDRQSDTIWQQHAALHNARAGPAGTLLSQRAVIGARKCPDWCEQWSCDSNENNAEWCRSGKRPQPCQACGCPKWCLSWYCDEQWCQSGGRPPLCVACQVTEKASQAQGPVTGAGPYAGWAPDHGSMSVTSGKLRVQGDSRVYLVKEYHRNEWSDHRYVRFDLQEGLSFDLDLSNVPCGCLACVYVR